MILILNRSANKFDRKILISTNNTRILGRKVKLRNVVINASVPLQGQCINQPPTIRRYLPIRKVDLFISQVLYLGDFIQIYLFRRLYLYIYVLRIMILMKFGNKRLSRCFDSIRSLLLFYLPDANHHIIIGYHKPVIMTYKL